MLQVLISDAGSGVDPFSGSGLLLEVFIAGQQLACRACKLMPGISIRAAFGVFALYLAV